MRKRVIGYIRLSVAAGERTAGTGEETQEQLLCSYAEMQGWDLLRIERDLGQSGAKLRRPGLEAAMESLDMGDADILLVAKLDRLSRAMADYIAILAQAAAQGWTIKAIDVGLETDTAVGALMANILMSFAQYERDQLIERTRAGMARAREAGRFPGKPSSLTDATVALIMAMKGAGKGYRTIARELEARGIPTARGGAQWYPSTVRGIITRQRASVQPADSP